jgi:hypothetical protein
LLTSFCVMTITVAIIGGWSAAPGMMVVLRFALLLLLQGDLGRSLRRLRVAHWGIGASMLIGAALCGIARVVTYVWAPETTGISLIRRPA